MINITLKLYRAMKLQFVDNYVYTYTCKISFTDNNNYHSKVALFFAKCI